ncbi:M20/M25/M40 family metallo-hydrolase [Plantibacter flavus]|uniref:M20/M25/M40 family metallo-hydrolase n=1 Tax=Plantibacter flavus TaxID=150123 RepID=UPI001873CC32|nr:M20/M25/M40 family metallo-hydrolase [Plantibacter flavus]
MPANETTVLDDTTLRLPEMLADLQRLVETESPSGDHAAVAASAAVVAELVEQRLGRAPEMLVENGCTHVRLRFGTTRVLLLAHHDTVWPLGSLAVQPFSIVDGVIRGPGCFDMKVGLVQAIHAMATLRDRGGDEALDGIELLVTGDEELGSPDSRELIEADAVGCSAALVLEASGDGGALKIGRKGVAVYRVDITGRAAHAGLEPELGVNAGVELAHQILRISEFGRSALGTTVTPTAAGVGTTSNTVPAAAHLLVDSRATSLDEQSRVDAEMHALTPVLAGALVTVDGAPNRPPMDHEHTGPVFARALRLAAEHDLGPLTGIDVGGGSDGNFTAGIGVPTLDGLGAVGGGAHAADEHALVDSIVPRTALLVHLVADLLP